MFHIYGEKPATKEVVSSLVCLKAWTTSLSCRFTENFTMASSATFGLRFLGEEGLENIWLNLGWMLRDDFLPFFIACLEALYLISIMFVLIVVFAILKVTVMVSSLAMPLQYFLLFGTLTCLGLTKISLVLKLYLLTPEIESIVITLVDRSSDPSYIIWCIVNDV